MVSAGNKSAPSTHQGTIILNPMAEENTFSTGETSDVPSTGNNVVSIDLPKKDKKMLYSERDKEKMYCGFGSWRPEFLQAVNRPSIFVALFSISGMMMVMVMGMNQIVMPMLQSLFNLSSTQMGWILVSNDISGIMFALVLGNFCSANKIRWVTIGIILSIISGIIQISPHLFAQLPEVPDYSQLNHSSSQHTRGICAPREMENTITQNSRFYAFQNNKLFWIFIVGGLVQGIGNSPPGIAGTTYMDEILTKRRIGPALALTTLAATVGLPFSYILGAQFLKIYTTLETPAEGITPGTPLWVGAWWLGFLVPTILMTIFGLPLALFPVQPMYAKDVLRKKEKEGLTSEEEKNVEINRSFKELLTDMIPTFKRLMSNKSFIFLLMGDSFFYLFLGSTAYDPKMRALAYQLSPSQTGTLLGIYKLITLAVGLGLGGIITAKVNLTGKRCVFMIMIVSVVTVPVHFLQLYYCAPNHIYGIDIPYPVASGGNISRMTGLESDCNSGCNCDTAFNEPVCDTRTQISYFSPCHAGCKNITTDMGHKMYTDCTCLDGGSVKRGKCSDSPDCRKKFWVFMAVTGIGVIVFFAGFPAMNIAYLRIVNEIDRTAAQGLRQFLTRICGTLPGPILFGYIIDQHCSVWREKNGERGNCWIYDVDRLVVTYTSVQIAVRGLCAACYVISWMLYPKKYTTVTEDINSDSTSDNIKIAKL